MARYKVGHGFRFTVDRSITGGIWLDAGEWEALRVRNFHDEIHHVFTEPWQRGIREDEARENARTRLKDRIGDELFEKIEALRTEISESGHKEEILTYIARKGQ